MSVDLSRLRLTFRVAADWGHWAEAERAEISEAIRLAIGVPAEIERWHAWLEDVSGIEAMRSACRAAEARIKVQAEEARRKAI